MAWYDGELFPASTKGWENAPDPEPPCTHDHVVALKDRRTGVPPVTSGQVMLYCLDCEEPWREDVALIKGSPWAG